MKAKSKITALFEFNSTGRLKRVFCNAGSEADQRILQKGLSDLLKPQRFEWVRRLFGKWA